MTEKIFEENVLQKSVRARVLEVRTLKKGFGIVLDRTVFFPEGGGQLSDEGELAAEGRSVRVSHVSIKEGIILHETVEALEVGTEVEARLDWQTRFDHMQQHLGEHILSYAFWKLFGANNVGFHMHPDMVDIDLDRELSYEEIIAAERMTNAHIEDDRKVTVSILTPEEAAKVVERKFNDKLTGPVRVVAVEGSDSCTCCGTHPPTAGMVGLVKILKVEHHKGGMRVFFLCGRLAMEAIEARLAPLKDASRLLSVKDEDIFAAVSRLKEENAALKAALHEERQKALEARLEKLRASAGAPVYKIIDSTLNAAEAKFLAQELSKDPQALVSIFYEQNGRVNYIFAQGEAAEGSAGERLKKASAALGGRGGGRPIYAQGSAPAKEGWEEIAQGL